MIGANNIAELANIAVADRCKKSFFAFVRLFWDVVIKEDPVYNWHIPYLCEELQKLAGCIVSRSPKPYDLIINIPPGTTKSTIATVMFPAWLWILDPSIRIITNSYSGSLSIEHATKSKDIIESDKFRKLFPNVVLRADKRGKQHYETTATGFRYATSTGSTITGYHAHIILSDDPINPKQAESPALRETGKEQTKTLSSRKVNKENTPMITIMQRLHDEDPTGYLLNKKSDAIKHICLPAELSDDVSPVELRERYIDGLLDPVRLSRTVLEEAKVDLGSRGYAGQFMQKPSPEGGNIIKSAWFGHISLSEFVRIKKDAPIVFFVDTAFTEKTTNDPTGIIAACRIGEDLYISRARKVNMEFPELVKFVPTFAFENGYTTKSSIRIEPKANGLSVIHQLKADTALNVTQTPTPKDSKETRLNAISPIVECGRIILVDGAWNEEFTDEVCGFPTKPHDEFVDLLYYAVEHFIVGRKKPIDMKRLSKLI